MELADEDIGSFGQLDNDEELTDTKEVQKKN